MVLVVGGVCGGGVGVAPPQVAAPEEEPRRGAPSACSSVRLGVSHFAEDVRRDASAIRLSSARRLFLSCHPPPPTCGKTRLAFTGTAAARCTAFLAPVPARIIRVSRRFPRESYGFRAGSRESHTGFAPVLARIVRVSRRFSREYYGFRAGSRENNTGFAPVLARVTWVSRPFSRSWCPPLGAAHLSLARGGA